jgi:hypothetical protein
MRFHSVCIAAAFAMLTVACDDGDDLTGLPEAALVRVVNAAAGTAGPVTVATGGTAIGSALTYGTAGATCTAVPITSGGNAFTFNVNGTTAGTITQSLTAGHEYTLVITGTGSAANAILVDNSTTTPTTGNYGVRFVNATVNAGDVYATPAGTQNLATSTVLSGGSNLAAFGSTGFLTSASANNMFWLTSANAPNTVFATTGNTGVAFPASRTSTIVFLPQANSTGSSFVQANDC